jgi:Na+/melibiose symporter-like transporter
VTGPQPVDRVTGRRPVGASRGLALLYGCGAMSLGANTQILGLLLLFYNQVVGLPANWVSLALAISLIIDAVWDPLVGQISDRLRSPWGRRHPFMYASALPIALSFILLWNPPVGWSQPALFGYLLATIIAYRLATSFYEVPSTALAPELAPDYDGRTVLLGYRYLFITLGGAVAMALAYGVFLRATPGQPMGQLNRAGYGLLSVAIAAMMAVAILVSSLGTHSRISKLHQPAVVKTSFAAALRDVVATLSNRNLGVALMAGLLSGMGAGMHFGLLIYLNTYFWQLPASNILILVLSGLISTPIAFVLAPAASRRWGKRNACMTMFFISIGSYALPVFLRLVGYFPANNTPPLVPMLTLFQIVTNILGVGGFILVTSMVADIVEESQVKTGRRSEGLLFAADTVLQKMVTGLSAVLPGLVLTFVRFPEHAQAGHMDPAVISRLGWTYLPLTCALSVASVATWGFYRIDRQTHERNLAALRDADALAHTTAP